MSKIWDRFKSLFSVFDARDVFCLVGFSLLYYGISQYSFPIANIVTGSIILLKGLTKWV